MRYIRLSVHPSVRLSVCLSVSCLYCLLNVTTHHCVDVSFNWQ